MIMRYNYVITTNFDYLIELVLQQALSVFPPKDNHQKKLMSIITKEDYEKDVRFKYAIIKIHGSKRDIINKRISKDSLVTTISALGRERERGDTFAIEPYKKKLIQQVIQDRNLVLMGYSGIDDFDISPMLMELPDIKGIIWIDHHHSILYRCNLLSNGKNRLCS
ncbi:MAG: hypothetical protein BAJALOKI1v1_270015 [Promethearchaeota archaeon]|nr:MAG: hypothetical protein BAJALOKI1v1_270015 [Candidatus Lokiarchaeota archaeon]